MNNSIFINLHCLINAVENYFQFWVICQAENQLIQWTCLVERRGQQCHCCDWLPIPLPAHPGTDGSGVRCHLHTPRSRHQSPLLEPHKPLQTRFPPSAEKKPQLR